MASLSRAPQRNHIKLADQIFDALKASTNDAPILPGDVKALVKDLRCISDVIGTETSTSDVQHWQEEYDWRQRKTPP